MEKALAAIHQAGLGQTVVRLEYGSFDGHVGLFCRFPDSVRSLVLGPLAANYPECRFDFFEPGHGESAATPTWYADLQLTPELYPILRHSQFEDMLTGSFEDPIEGILKAIQPEPEVDVRVEITIQRAVRARCRCAKLAVKRLDGPFLRRHYRVAGFYAIAVGRPWLGFLAWPLGLLARGGEVRIAHTDTTGSRTHDREDDVQAASDKIGGHLFETHVRLFVRCEHPAKAHERLRALGGAFGSFTKSRLATFRMSRVSCLRPRLAKRKAGQAPFVPNGASPRFLTGFNRPTHFPARFRKRGFLLSAEELATLFHPPTAGVRAERLAATAFRELEPPVVLHASEERDGQTVVGQVLFRDDQRLVGIGREDRLRHVHVLGRTGVGKSTLLLNQIVRDIEQGSGICVIDPHGDLAAAVIRAIPRHRTNDVILFDPADEEYSVAFNPLHCPDPARRDLVADDVLSAFQQIHDLSQTPRLKDTLRNALYVLVEKGKTLLNLLIMLSDEAYRERLTADIEDDVVRLFWHREFAGWNDRYRTEALSAIQNKLRPFLMNRQIRAIVGQTGHSLSLRDAMDSRRVLVVPLSKGRLGEVNVRLFGSLLVTSIQQAAMTRADVAESQRADFWLYIDELHNFTTPSFASMLSEIRKYRVGLIGSHQFLDQLDEDTAAALAGNVGSRIVFQTGAEDADRLAKLLAKYPGQVTAQDLTNLPKYTAIAQLLMDGMPSNPFTIRTLPHQEPRENRTEPVRRASARRYARPASNVRLLIRREFGASDDGLRAEQMPAILPGDRVTRQEALASNPLEPQQHA